MALFISMIDFENWFLLAYTGYVVVSILALMWIASDDEQNNSDKTFRQTTQRLGDRQ